MLQRISFFLCLICLSFFNSEAKCNNKLTRLEVKNAKAFVRKLTVERSFQDDGYLLDNLVQHRELSLKVNDGDEKHDFLPLIKHLPNLSFLKKLTLIGFGLTEIRGEILTLTNLVKLDLSGNKLESITQEIAKLKQLEELDLSYNFISELPDHIGSLAKLKRLRLSHNFLYELPPHFKYLVQIRRLDLSCNTFEKIPRSLLGLRRITRLDLSSNLIETVPVAFAQLDNLKLFNLRGNFLLDIGQGHEWGARELRSFFGKRVWFSNEHYQDALNFVPKTIEEAAKETVWNLSKLKEARLFVTPQNTLGADEAVALFEHLLHKVDFKDEASPAYLDHTVLFNEDELEERRDLEGLSNEDILKEEILPILKGYIRQLFAAAGTDVPDKGWQPETKDKVEFQNGLVFALRLIQQQTDTPIRTLAMGTLIKGILHCPTALKSALDTLSAQFVMNEVAQGETFPVLVKKALARLKEAVFPTVILPRGNAENSHILEYYKRKLGPVLGLSSSAPGYKDKISRLGYDHFYGHAGNALSAFLYVFDPSRVDQALCNPEHGLSTRETGLYLIQNKLVDYENDEKWWKGFFTADPLIDEKARPLRYSMFKALNHLGYFGDKDE